MPLSKENICPLVEDEIKKAYLELHRCNLPGDVHAGNILVSSDKSVFIADFEFSRMALELTLLENEMSRVTNLLDKTKRD